MTRQQITDVSAPERIQGIAAPVSTYVRPADPGRSPLNELAEGLAGFDQGLGSFMQKRKAETDEADKVKAITDFHRNNQKGYADAVREGLIPATASKAYVEWYKRQQGHLAGLKLGDKFNLDYKQWGGRDTADSTGYSKFVSDWMAKNVGSEQDSDVLSGLAPHLDQLATNGYDTFSRDRDASLKSKSKATSGAILTDTVLRSQETGRVEGSVDYDALWGNLMTQREEAISKGERGEDFDQLIVDSVLLQAEEAGDTDLLTILDKTLPGHELPISRNTDVREKILKARDGIERKQAADVTDRAQVREKIEKRQHEDLLSVAIVSLSQGEDVPEEVIQQLSRRDGEIRYKLAKYNKEYGELGIEEDPTSLMHVYQQIDEGAGASFVTDMRDKGVIRKPETFLKAIDRIKAVREASTGAGIFNSPTYKDTVKFITARTDRPVDERDPTGDRIFSDETMEALYDYRNKVLDWSLKNPDAGPVERERAAKEAGDFIRSRLQEDILAGANIYTYRSEADEKAGSQKSSTEAGHGGYTPSASDRPGVGNTAKPSPLDGLAPQHRQAVETLAKAKGLTLEEAQQLLQQRIDRLRSGK
ncbi:hypothetical protein [Agrobacterium rosae]|uniref:hypothetical protein n=1 Tax=Agrobacterium rosae TaxID=1972867 RepID=UPI000CD95CE9|nr:hypothetical protein [Agrobacterium rosae]POO56169.1 hypothetical protein CTT39_05330 [Agrobacterium rosae]